MKKALAVVMSVLMLLTFFPANILAQAEAVSVKPFYFVNFDRTFDASDYSYVNWMPYTWINTEKFSADSAQINIGVYFSEYSTADLNDAAAELYDEFKNRPAGTRHISFNAMKTVFEHCVKDAVDMEDGVRLVKDWLSRFLDAYKALGGELDGISIDLEYNFAYNFYIESVHYNHTDTTKRNTNIYNDIVANKVYQERIRPKLVEYEKQGLWKFYENPDPAKYPERSEIWTIYRYDNKGGDATCRVTWNQVIQSLLVEYINEATYEPLIARYPNAVLSDYQTGDMDAWQKYLNHMGDQTLYTTVKAGNYSNFVSYNFTPDYRFYGYASAANRTKRTKYQTPYSYNGAVFGDNAYDRALWGINNHKRMMNSTEDGKMNVWVTFYNYGDKTGYGNTPYFSEVYYHLGMTNPDPFYGYILPRDLPLQAPENATDNDLSYDYHLRVVDELMAELTRVAGASDRKPIITPVAWNEGYILSGMYAGGRNIWRITPDTDKVSVADFKRKDTAPTFRVGNVTITFPQGRIIADSPVTHVGTCGYWVETPANVTPVVTSTADRYQNDPSFQDAFNYATGAFTTESVLPDTYWTVSGNAAIVENGGNKAVSLTGSATLTNAKVPEQITAGDYYAKQQAWEVTLTLPADQYGVITLLSSGSKDGGIQIAKGKVCYDRAGSYRELPGVTLSAGTYTVKRELDFRTANAYTCSYTIYDAAGNHLGGVDNVPLHTITLPVANITLAVSGATAPVLLDDYKLYPTGVTTCLDLYGVDTGRALTDPDAAQTRDVGYRLSWMNAGASYKVARIYDVKTGKVLQKVEMAPGMDGVVAGLVEIGTGQAIRFAVNVNTETAPTQPNYDNGNFRWTAVSETIGLATGVKPAASGNDDTQETVPPTTEDDEEGENIFDVVGGNGNGEDLNNGSDDPIIPSGSSDDAENPGDPNAPVDPENHGTDDPADSGKKGMGGGIIALIVILSLAVLAGGIIAVKFTKEDLLALNKKRNKIREPKKK